MSQPISIAENRDCMEAMREFPDKFFDLAVVDPPYFKGVGKLGYMGEKNSSIGVKRGEYDIPNWDENIPDENYFNELLRVSKHQIIWGINYYRFYHTAGAIVWDKCNDHSSFSDCEIASCSLHDSVRIFRFLWDGMRQGAGLSAPTRKRGNAKLNEKRIHPTQKPIALYQWILKEYAKPANKILDTHLGSASHRVAAYKMGFDFWGYEIDQKTFADAERRFKRDIAAPLFEQPKTAQGELL